MHSKANQDLVEVKPHKPSKVVVVAVVNQVAADQRETTRYAGSFDVLDGSVFDLVSEGSTERQGQRAFSSDIS